MDYFLSALQSAITLIITFDDEIWQIVQTSLNISLQACLYASVIAVPAGILLAIKTFSGKQPLIYLLQTLTAMPTVMVGLILYGLLSRRGPLGEWGLLYTETAIILGQSILIIPLIIHMSTVTVSSADPRLLNTLTILGASTSQKILTIIAECRYALLAAVLTAFGRAIGEVGAAMMLGGNIQGVTRTMTTAIALETSKGNFELGLALGLLLLAIAFFITFLLQFITATTSTSYK
jgi:tungstate transport system permease protein